MPARAYNKILKVSCSIADLDGAEEIRTEHVTIQCRAVDFRACSRRMLAASVAA